MNELTAKEAMGLEFVRRKAEALLAYAIICELTAAVDDLEMRTDDMLSPVYESFKAHLDAFGYAFGITPEDIGNRKPLAKRFCLSKALWSNFRSMLPSVPCLDDVPPLDKLPKIPPRPTWTPHPRVSGIVSVGGVSMPVDPDNVSLTEIDEDRSQPWESF